MCHCKPLRVCAIAPSWHVIYQNISARSEDDELNDARAVASLNEDGYTFHVAIELWATGVHIARLAVAVIRARRCRTAVG
jgi:hypothetical protein